MKTIITAPLLVAILCLVNVRTVAAASSGKFSVSPEDGFVIKLNGVPVAHTKDPKTDPKARIIREKQGFTVVGKGVRKEYAIFDDRLEYTFDFALPPPATQALSILLPLPKGATAAVRHGRTHPAPPKKMIYHAGKLSGGKALKHDAVGPAAPDVGGSNAVFPLRYITVKTDSYSLSVDVQPAGANSEDPSYAESPLRIFACRQVEQGAEIVARIPRGYSSYCAHLKGKIIFYGDGRPFETVHPFAFANEYGPLEKYVWLDFSNRKQKRKSHPTVVGTGSYDAKKKYGWASDASDLKLVSTDLESVIYGTFVTSARPAKFRIAAPPGYYYLTLNIGNADGRTGPFRVNVNGEERLKRIALEKGRFRNELLLLKTTGPPIEIEPAGIGGASWLLNGLAVEPLGTLNEDFVFTRPWWHFRR